MYFAWIWHKCKGIQELGNDLEGEPASVPVMDPVVKQKEEPKTEPRVESVADPAIPQAQGTRPVRDMRPPDRYGEWVYLAHGRDEPNSISDAMKSPESEKWWSAMKEEVKSLMDNDVYDLVELPAGRKAVGSKWVYKEKVGSDGTTERFKARLVA